MKKKFLIPIVLLLGLSVVSSCGENIGDNNSTTSSESAHEHTYSSEYSKDETKHWYSDTCGHNTKKDEAEHTYSEWVEVKAATTTEEGLERRECSVCGYEETRNISKLKVNITFNSKGGNAIDNISLNYGEAIEVVPTKDNCLFLGWYDETLTTKYESAPQSDITLCAEWLDLSKYICSYSYTEDIGYFDISINRYIGSDAEVVIPKGVIGIHDFAFAYCSNLTSITIPSTVTSIDDNAFEGCFKLVEVINKSFLNIEKGSENFGMVGYYAIEVKNSGESSIVNKDGCLFYTVDAINYLVGYTGSETELILPNDYNGESYIISKYSFYEHNSLTSLVIPSGVTNIGESAFNNCSNLTSITIPESVTSIEYQAFSRCYRLVEIINKSSLNITKASWDFGGGRSACIRSKE